MARRTVRRLGWLLRYSMSRDAYIVRGVGGWVGPVFKVVEEAPPSGTVHLDDT